MFPTPGITPYLFSRQQAGTGAQDDNSNPFDSPSDPTSSERADTSELPYTAIIHSKSRSPTRFAPNRYGEMPVSPEPYIATPPDSAYAPSTEPSERVYLRSGPPSSGGHTSSQGSRIGGPRGPRDDVKGSISSSRPLPARPPAQHSDSGMRFGPPRPPPTEVMSEVMTEIPPAYTAS